jgi:hypothetical protein
VTIVMPLNKKRFLLKISPIFLCIMFFICCFSDCVYAGKSNAVKESHIIWIAGSLPEGSIEQGNWIWDQKFTHDGAITHTQISKDHIDRRSFLVKDAIGTDEKSGLVQYVYLDPKNAPEGIMLKLIFSSGEEQVFYWEGYEEAFVELDEYIHAWYMGFIPDSGKWVRLFIDFRELDKPKAEITGMEFILNNGRAWWGTTIIENIG